MITVHHIVNSRSQRILWMLEELGLEYDIVVHTRDSVTARAPEALKRAHPLGKAPSVVLDGRPMAESGAIIMHLAERHGLVVAVDDVRRSEYLFWMHFGETLMSSFVLASHARRLGAPAALAAYAVGEIDAGLAHMNATLAGREWLLGETFTAADVHNGYGVDVAVAYGRLPAFANLRRYRDTLHARPAYRRALEKGGPFTLGQSVPVDE